MFSVGAILSSPAIVGDTLYVGSADGYLYAIS
jgi:outer membrane protein assembly factor BamB